MNTLLRTIRGTQSKVTKHNLKFGAGDLQEEPGMFSWVKKKKNNKKPERKKEKKQQLEKTNWTRQRGNLKDIPLGKDGII